MALRILSFELGGRPFGLRIDQLAEVAGLPHNLRRVPGAPECVVGVGELRGSLLTVLDPAAALGLSWAGREEHVAVLRAPRGRVGLLLRGAVDILLCEEGPAAEPGEGEPERDVVCMGTGGDRELLDPEAVVAVCRERIRRRG